MQFDEGCEGGIDLVFGAGLQDRELHPLGARRFLHLSYHALGIRLVRVHEQRDNAWPGEPARKAARAAWESTRRR